MHTTSDSPIVDLRLNIYFPAKCVCVCSGCVIHLYCSLISKAILFWGMTLKLAIVLKQPETVTAVNECVGFISLIY